MKKKPLRYYLYILYKFYKEKQIWDDDLKNHLLDRFEKSYQNYEGFNDISIEVYLTRCLRTIHRNYWVDRYRHDKVREKVLRQWFAETCKKYARKYWSNNPIPNLAVLNNKQYKVVRLYLSNWQTKDIAEELDTTENNVRQIYSRAVKELRRNISNAN